MDTQGSLTHIATIFKFGDVSGPRGKKMTQSKSRIKNGKLFYMYAGTSPVGGTVPQKLI